MEDLRDKTVLVTGGAYRLGKVMALAAARAGADVIVHHGHSPLEAEATAAEIRALGRRARVLQADLGDPNAVKKLFATASEMPLYALVNNAAVFTPGGMLETSLAVWQENLAVNLTAPFLLSQAFLQVHMPGQPGRILNIIDWRALRPGRDHFAYTISKSALSALTQSTALAAAPDVSVNAIALGAILPPRGEPIGSDEILRSVPAKRWAQLSELESAFLFLLCGPAYVTGEIIHLDGGRHLV